MLHAAPDLKTFDHAQYPGFCFSWGSSMISCCGIGKYSFFPLVNVDPARTHPMPRVCSTVRYAFR